MGGTAQNGFDGRRLADLIGLVDSPVDAEAAGAVHRIRVLKKKHGDAPFYALMERDEYKDALWEKLGGCAAPCEPGAKCSHGPESLRGWFEKKHGGGDSVALAEARTLIEKLQQDNAQLERDGSALAIALKRQEDTISELRRRHPAPARASSQGTSVPARQYVGGLLAFAGVMGAAALLIAGVMWIVTALFGGS
jgi:hypothetical protein